MTYSLRLLIVMQDSYLNWLNLITVVVDNILVTIIIIVASTMCLI
jgi:hypothetical protein